MYCSKCGSENPYDGRFCRNCSAPLSNGVEDKASIGMNILSFLIPIVGLICYFAWKKETPKKAEGALFAGIGGFVVTLILMAI